MAEYNLIQNPQLLARLTKALGLRQGHVTPALNEGLQAVILVEDLTLTGRPDRRPVRGWVYATSAGANVWNAVLRNPVGSGVIARVNEVSFWSSVATDYDIGIQQLSGIPADTIAGDRSFIDSKNVLAGSPVGSDPRCTVGAKTDDGIQYATINPPGPFHRFPVAANITDRFGLDVTVLPGCALVVSVEALVLAGRSTFAWTEESEQAGL